MAAPSVTVPAAVLRRYRRFSLFNSPYPAHDRGRAIDLYPDGGRAPAPVAGEVVDVRTVRAPPRPHADPEDHLVVVDTGEHLARILHVEPGVCVGDRIEPGDDLGRLVRSGFFAPWVPDHLHLGFRDRDADPYRASGSLPVAAAVDVAGLGWDGTGTVVGAGETWARLDAPAHPATGERFVGLAAGGDDFGGDVVLDGGFPHYDGGGLLGGSGALEDRGDPDGGPPATGGAPVEIGGTRVGTARGRSVAWRDCRVLANGEPVTGIALFCARDRFGAKLVGDGIGLEPGAAVSVRIETSG